MKKDENILLHMYDDITDIINFTKDIDFNNFVENSLIRKAVCMSLINLGELSKLLSPEFKAKNNTVPWKNISGLRDITAHKYHTLNLDIIWAVVKYDIPEMELFIKKIFNKDSNV
jgi:uncharacterized protein with HEPN domain